MQVSEWIKSGGGPLLIVNTDAAPYWGGVLALNSADDRFSSDYDKACEIESYLADVQVNGSSALLLGDAPLDTCFWRDDHDTMYLVRVWYCEIEFDIDVTMKNIPLDLFRNAVEVLPYTVLASDYMMFDSAEPGDDLKMKVVHARLGMGRYHILTQPYKPDAYNSFILHRFDWLGRE